MKTIEEIKNILAKHRQELQQKYKVKTIAIFGSYARGEETEESDVDILVEFTEPVGLLFVDLAEYLEKILGVKVDLVPRDAIKPNRRKYIEEDLLYV